MYPLMSDALHRALIEDYQQEMRRQAAEDRLARAARAARPVRRGLALQPAPATLRVSQEPAKASTM